MRISDWSSDVCSSDLVTETQRIDDREDAGNGGDHRHAPLHPRVRVNEDRLGEEHFLRQEAIEQRHSRHRGGGDQRQRAGARHRANQAVEPGDVAGAGRSEEHTSELQSLMRIPYAVLGLKKKTQNTSTPCYSSAV